ncbi:hypothetical protein DUI87_08155 [Hirundo rustica rustica]|uniref:Cadherin domain-containing protein n=1 Tax=Hirundo rustica rustica TaxID=333673 RepID=A0A3M0KRP8_HIRRU|nr:hypothetical protein DUI87_08155 [Hirundo rustica rustica]
MGPDGIHPRVMRELADELAKPLSIIYHQSWLTGEIPDDWKLANVTSFHKKGGREDPSNYRPVILTSVPGKIMEQFVLSLITQNLQDGQGLRPSQHGFRRGKSCFTNLISFYDQVTHLVDAGKAVDVVYLDLSKAFDTVSHSILLDKLATHGLDRSTLHWVRDCLDGQAQRVVVNGAASSWGQSPVVSLRGLCWGQFCSIFLLLTWMRILNLSLVNLRMTLSWEYDWDNPGLVSHVPVGVRILDVNDNPPELARDYDVVVCENTKPGQVIQTITATDKDNSANGARFHFSLDDGLSLNPNFTLRNNEDNTASILTRRRRYSRTTQDTYYLPVLISDGGVPPLSSSSTLTIRVCACERDGRVRTCHAEAFLSSAGLSTGALIAILLCIVILLDVNFKPTLISAVFSLAIVVLFITLRRSKKEPLIISEEDVRENVVTYDDEGGGEEDTEAFDITALRNPSAAEELKYRRDVRPEVKPLSRHHPSSSLDSIDVQEFIKQRLAEADLDPSVPPYDSLQTYAYEGHRSEAGSISSLDSATTHSDQDYNYLGDWGPEFKKLAELYGEIEPERTT